MQFFDFGDKRADVFVQIVIIDREVKIRHDADRKRSIAVNERHIMVRIGIPSVLVRNRVRIGNRTGNQHLMVGVFHQMPHPPSDC